MQLGPNIIRTCPKCSEPFIEPTMLSGNNFGAKVWSDQKVEAPMLMDEKRFVTCNKCNSAFWLEQSRKIDELEWDDTIKQYPNAAFSKSPTSKHYIAALSESILDSEDELYLRTNLFHVLNDRFRDEDSTKPFAPISEEDSENKRKLLELLDENPENLLLKAEIWRELGEFDQALSILNTSFPSSHKFANILIEKCLQKNTDVVLINPTEK